jgi:peptidoglycan/xylan/chitin deacetylase (PgdA/CDA1 family)
MFPMSSRQKFQLIQTKVWSNQYAFALALSHDVDRVAKRGQFAYYIPQAIVSRRFDQLRCHLSSIVALLRGDDPYWNFERIMSLEDELGVRSTFFFLNEQGKTNIFKPQSMALFGGRYDLDSERIKQVIRKLLAGGWEIGVHGSYNSYQDGSLLKSEKEQLENILSQPVKGIRQHYLNLDVPETWQRQAKAGFTYDSSLGYSGRVGFRWHAVHPFYPRDPLTGERIPILQLPMAMMDGPLMQTDDPWREALALIDQAEQKQGVLTINWHQRAFNPWEYRERQEMYVRIIKECQQRGAWIAPLGEVAERWSYVEAES